MVVLVVVVDVLAVLMAVVRWLTLRLMVKHSIARVSGNQTQLRAGVRQVPCGASGAAI